MQKVKQLNKLIEQTCSDIHNQPPVKLYYEILSLVQSRVDMPKHSIYAISKKLTIKSKKTLFICFDLLEYLSYNLELPFFSQIATKQFLFKISGLMMSKQIDPVNLDKILKLVKCLDEVFRPLEDLLPLFFQFQAGLLRKQYNIPYQYMSPYRPKQLKQYKKPQKRQEQRKKPVIQPTKNEQNKFQQIREQILLTNQIINSCSPADNVRNNQVLLQMMQHLKKCEKTINQVIDENPTQLIMELALAANDDLFITYRRFKDLQKNKKPQQFFMAEIASSVIKEEKQRQAKKSQISKPQPKTQTKPQASKYQSVFDAFQNSTIKKEPSFVKVQVKQPVQIQKREQPANIFDLLDAGQKQTQVTESSNLWGLMDITQPQNTINNAQGNGMISDLLESSTTQNGQNQSWNDILSIDFINNPNQTSNSPQLYPQQAEQALYQQNTNQEQYVYQQNLNQRQIPQQFGTQPPLYSNAPFQNLHNQPLYQNITLSSNIQKKQEQDIDPQKLITKMDDFHLYLGSQK